MVNVNVNEDVIAKESEDDNIKNANSFLQFWKAYDKKRGVDWCRDVWLGRRPLKNGDRLTAEDRDAILAHVAAYVKSTPEKQTRKDPKTYLNNRAWLDEIIQPTDGGQGWPSQWSKTYELTLQPKQLLEWRRHLRDVCGLLPLFDAKKRCIEWVPKEERDERQKEILTHG